MEFDSTFAAINAFGGVDYAPHNKGVTPVFFIEPVPDPVATEKAGHPVSRDMERVRLYIVGDSLSAAAHPVDEGVKRRFPEEYEKWKRTKSGVGVKGMRLAQWPMATPAMIAELGGLNIFSVEDLAAVSDGNVQNIVDGRAIRDKAIAWLAQAKDGAAVMKYAAQVTRLQDEVAELRKLVRASSGADEETVRAPAPRRAKKEKKAKTKGGWTPERRKAASEAAKARGFGGRPAVAKDEEGGVELGAVPGFSGAF